MERGGRGAGGAPAGRVEAPALQFGKKRQGDRPSSGLTERVQQALAHAGNASPQGEGGRDVDCIGGTGNLMKHHGGSFGGYMDAKNQKLRLQLERDRGDLLGVTHDADDLSAIFQGVCIHVNGFTDPGHQELRRLMLKHGGAFEHYFHNDRVTHIICTHLPDVKYRQALAVRARSPPKLVAPAWVVDCIAAGKRLPEGPYMHERLAIAPGQARLRFDAGAASAVPEEGGREEGAAGGAEGGAGNREAQEVARQARAECDVLRMKPRSTRDDPNFVSTFYKASRLHFIGSWKARNEALTAKLATSAPVPRRAVHGGARSILHVDMDCFFASIAARGRPALQGVPLAVCHSDNTAGGAEISSCNYEARAFGIKAGMWMAKAKELCPRLVVMPYEFDRYHEASDAMYTCLLRYTAAVQPVSCDEAFLDVTGLGDAEDVAARLRADIFDATGCTASCGIGPNMICARLATKAAKPNGQRALLREDAAAQLQGMPVKDLPGVGWSTAQRLRELGIETCGDVRGKTTQRALQELLGAKTGAELWAHAVGEDDREVRPPQPRKSIGAECSWGVRLDGAEDGKTFIEGLAAEVARRLREAGCVAASITVKVKKRRPGAPTPRKHLGHGVVDTFSRSQVLGRAVSSQTDVFDAAWEVLRQMGMDWTQIRGIGITMQRLSRPAEHPGAASGPLAAAFGAAGEASGAAAAARGVASPAQQGRLDSPALARKSRKRTVTPPSAGRAKRPARRQPPASEVALPPASQLDPAVIDSLPLPVKRDLEKQYGFRLDELKKAAATTAQVPTAEAAARAGAAEVVREGAVSDRFWLAVGAFDEAGFVDALRVMSEAGVRSEAVWQLAQDLCDWNLEGMCRVLRKCAAEGLVGVEVLREVAEHVAAWYGCARLNVLDGDAPPHGAA